MPARDVLKLVYKAGMIAATVVLAVLAYLAYRSSTPGTGDVLLSIILAILAFFALLSIPKLDWQDEQAETYRGMFDDLRRLRANVRFTSGPPPADSLPTGAKPGGAPTGPHMTVHFAEPEVHRVDANVLDQARRMAAEGAPIDDICRMVDPGHDRNDELHREAFRRIVQAMIDEG